jgi:hypothetical protein
MAAAPPAANSAGVPDDDGGEERRDDLRACVRDVEHSHVPRHVLLPGQHHSHECGVDGQVAAERQA